MDRVEGRVSGGAVPLAEFGSKFQPLGSVVWQELWIQTTAPQGYPTNAPLVNTFVPPLCTDSVESCWHLMIP
jgi:hypothetical protein